MIKAINVNKIYQNGQRQLHVLKDININVERGEFVAVAGPSGAGKSTLLHVLGGLDTPTDGGVIFDEIDLYETIDFQRAKIRNEGIGFVFQFYHLMPEFSALENVLMPALVRVKAQGSRVKARERAKELLETLGLQERMTHRPGELSGGEQQRVAIARALINSPKLLLCDEPTGNLDSRTGSEVMRILLQLNKEDSLTCVMVTHEERVAQGAGRVIHMMDGRII